MSTKRFAKVNNYVRAAASLIELAPPSRPSKRIEDPLSRTSLMELYAEGYEEIGDSLRQSLGNCPQRPRSWDTPPGLLSEKRAEQIKEIAEAIAKLELLVLEGLRDWLRVGNAGQKVPDDKAPSSREQPLSASP